MIAPFLSNIFERFAIKKDGHIGMLPILHVKLVCSFVYNVA